MTTLETSSLGSPVIIGFIEYVQYHGFFSVHHSLYGKYRDTKNEFTNKTPRKSTFQDEILFHKNFHGKILKNLKVRARTEKTEHILHDSGDSDRILAPTLDPTTI